MTPEIPGAELDGRRGNVPAQPLLSVRRLSKTYVSHGWFARPRPIKRALEEASVEISSGETVALVGPSGAGKSTLARCIAGRERWDSGSVDWHSAVPVPQRVQLVQQEPSGSLNPGMTIGQALHEACGQATPELLPLVRLPREWIGRKVEALSEGQRARVAILRSVQRLKNGLLILDESLSGLDPATRSYIVSYLAESKKQKNLSVLAVTHDPEIAAEFGARIVRMESGRIAA